MALAAVGRRGLVVGVGMTRAADGCRERMGVVWQSAKYMWRNARDNDGCQWVALLLPFFIALSSHDPSL